MFSTRFWSRLRRRLSGSRGVSDGAHPPFRYPEGRHGGGELTYQDGIPVLRLSGTPEELGEQAGRLGVAPAPRLLHYPLDLLAFFLRSRLLSRFILRHLIRIGRGMVAQFPESYRREFHGLVAGGLPRDLMVAANTMFDMKNLPVSGLFGCSSLIVDAEHSDTGGPLFGRNMDFFPLGYLHDYGLVIVYPRAAERPHGFVSVGYPGMMGCFSGMNDAGLSVASHEVFGPTPRRKLNRKGLTFALMLRRILEECETVESAYELLRRTERATSISLLCCDRSGGAVFEVTPDHVFQRDCIDGFAVCTNHFCIPQLTNPRQKNTYRTIDRIHTLRNRAVSGRKFGVDDVRQRLDDVHQGELTLHTMVFEPAAKRLHLSLGPPPSTRQQLTTLDIAALLKA